MAKVIFGDQGTPGTDPYTGELFLEINDQKTKGVYTDDDSGATILFSGSKLEAALEDDNYFLSGSIDKVILKDGDNATLVTFSGNYKAAKLSAAFQEGGVDGLTESLFARKDNILGGAGDDLIHGYSSKDVINGGKGDDRIFGDLGNDVLTGGKGSDTFSFNFAASEDGNLGDDVITDFDIKGEETDGLFITSPFDTSSVHKGHDTLLSFDNGTSILLEDVRMADFEQWRNSAG